MWRDRTSCSQNPKRNILSGCTEITLGGIRIVAGAKIYGSLYHYGTMTHYNIHISSNIRPILNSLSKYSLLCTSSIISHILLSSIFIITKFYAFLFLQMLGKVFVSSIIFIFKSIINTYFNLIITKPNFFIIDIYQSVAFRAGFQNIV